ncbi:carbohydrate sulfotransferase 11 isoform X2 [Vanessa atalanta]|uniref:carbohydrate sulfotransferase 11 isoform X2 n=1 Tax=Vanessa atalanta TaxID=42275 RepID=UPI001FCE18F2|nr:carbohydrate sulfotransferase 11 isoform X2 [Vanessa atalanta]
MIFPSKRLRSRIKTKAFPCLRCGAKTLTFLFWATLYIVVMKMTLLKSSGNQTPRDWSIPDNYTKWLLQGPVLGDDNESDATDNDWLEPDNATVIELEKRVVRAQEVCRQRSLQTQDINSKEFFVDHAHNIVWCNIFKAASSSWLYNFNILAGYDKKFLARTRHTPLTLARKKFPRPSEEELRDTITTPGVISLLVVREPFVRLLSAYRDKLENITPPYYRKLARKIVAEHREAATKVLGPIKSFGPTFREFVAYLIARHSSDPAPFDEHWAPYHKFCTPCAVNFTVIAKVETLSRDSSFVVQRLGLGHVLRRVRGRRTRLRTVMNKSRDGRDTAALRSHYFGQLDAHMLGELLEIYGIDFDMFGYDADIYRRYVRK